MPMTMLFPGYLALGYVLVIWWYTSIAAYTATAAVPVYREQYREPAVDGEVGKWIAIDSNSPQLRVKIKRINN